MPNTQSHMLNPLLSPRSHAWPKAWDQDTRAAPQNPHQPTASQAQALSSARNAANAYGNARRVAGVGSYASVARFCAERYIDKRCAQPRCPF